MPSWDKELFKRIPSDLFDDPIWNNGKFTKKEALLDLYYLAHDSPNNKSAIVDINEVLVSIDVGDVIRGYRSLSERWGWSTKKVGKFLNDYGDLEYLKVIKKHPCTVIRLPSWILRRKQGGNTEETQGRQLNSNYNKNNKRGAMSEKASKDFPRNNDKKQMENPNSSPDVIKLYQLFIGDNNISPSKSEFSIVSEALERQPLEFWKPIIAIYHKSGDKKVAKFFFESDYTKYLHHPSISYTYECPIDGCDKRETRDSKDLYKLCKEHPEEGSQKMVLIKY